MYILTIFLCGTLNYSTFVRRYIFVFADEESYLNITLNYFEQNKAAIATLNDFWSNLNKNSSRCSQMKIWNLFWMKYCAQVTVVCQPRVTSAADPTGVLDNHFSFQVQSSRQLVSFKNILDLIFI